MTKEEAKEVFLNRGFINGIFDGDKWRQSILIISELLEQESVFDKIRAEIESKEMIETTSEREFYNMALDDVLQIMDKYKNFQNNKSKMK